MEIGGYFELELQKGKGYHTGAISVNTGRNALELALLHLKWSKIFLPYYTCDVILEPFIKMGIDYEFYYISENFESEFDYSNIESDEGLLYTNYFGLKIILSRLLQKNVIILLLIIRSRFSPCLYTVSRRFIHAESFSVSRTGHISILTAFLI